MERLDFSALSSRPYSDKAAEAFGEAPCISPPLPSFPLPQVQDVSAVCTLIHDILLLCSHIAASLASVTNDVLRRWTLSSQM